MSVLSNWYMMVGFSSNEMQEMFSIQVSVTISPSNVFQKFVFLKRILQKSCVFLSMAAFPLSLVCCLWGMTYIHMQIVEQLS